MSIQSIHNATFKITLIAAALLAALAAACTGTTPGHCTDDRECQDATREGYDPARPHCHGEGGFCYAGCVTDADCADTTRTWYEKDRPYCHPGTRDCVAKKPTWDLGPDMGDAGAPDASDGGGPDTVDQALPDTGLPNGVKCTAGGTPCKSGFCVDGYCCDKKCDGVCQSCKLSGIEGLCTPHAVNTDPEDGCPGAKACGNDACDGQGKCIAAAPKTTECDNACKGSDPFTLQQFFCDGSAGTCVTTATDKPCKPYKCAGAAGKAACATGCATHADCHADSLCDRAEAHKAGKGICAKPADVLKVGPAETNKTVQAGVTAALAAKQKYVKVAAGTYAETVDVKGASGGVVVIVGAGVVELKPTASSVSVLTVDAGHAVTLQGLTLRKADLDGVSCSGKQGSATALTILESIISDNDGQGVEASYCDVTLRRSSIQSNKGGGIKLSDGALIIVNNLVVGNGSAVGAGSSLGGVQLSPGTGSVTFSNNTVADNLTKGVAAGVICSGKGTLTNSILWGNTGGSAQHLGCSFTYSDVSGSAPSGTGNISKDPKLDSSYKLQTGSPCLDTGAATTGVTVLDLAGNPRPDATNKKVDMGAHEKQ